MTPPLGRPFLFCGLCLLLTFGGVLHAAPPPRTFDIPVGDAARTLQRFAVQSGEEVLFATDAVKGIRTNAVKGAFAAEEAVRQMLSGTSLHLVSDTKNGVLRIARAPDPNAPRAAQTTPCTRPGKEIQPPSATPPQET